MRKRWGYLLCAFFQWHNLAGLEKLVFYKITRFSYSVGHRHNCKSMRFYARHCRMHTWPLYLKARRFAPCWSVITMMIHTSNLKVSAVLRCHSKQSDYDQRWFIPPKIDPIIFFPVSKWSGFTDSCSCATPTITVVPQPTWLASNVAR